MLYKIINEEYNFETEKEFYYPEVGQKITFYGSKPVFVELGEVEKFKNCRSRKLFTIVEIDQDKVWVE